MKEDLLDQVRAARRHLAEAGPARVREPGDFEKVSIPRGDADALRDILLAERPRTVIEIGLAYGSSALAIAEALLAGEVDDPQHLIIDGYQDGFFRSGWSAVEGAGLGGICTLIEDISYLALPRLLSEGLTADAAFVDGSHLFHNVLIDLLFLGEMVRPHGVVVLDDCEYLSVATAARYFELNMGWQPEPIPVETRLRAFRLPAAPARPEFTDFKPFGLQDV